MSGCRLDAGSERALSSTYLYRVLKAGWGIHVLLRAEVRSGTPSPAALPVVEGLFVVDATAITELLPEQMRMLAEGLRLVAAEMVAAVPEQPVTVRYHSAERRYVFDFHAVRPAD